MQLQASLLETLQYSSMTMHSGCEGRCAVLQSYTLEENLRRMEREGTLHDAIQAAEAAQQKKKEHEKNTQSRQLQAQSSLSKVPRVFHHSKTAPHSREQETSQNGPSGTTNIFHHSKPGPNRKKLGYMNHDSRSSGIKMPQILHRVKSDPRSEEQVRPNAATEISGNHMLHSAHENEPQPIRNGRFEHSTTL